MNKYLLSAIIPTRNRQQYAAGAVKSILNLNKGIQVIVQDNSDDDSLRGFLEDVISNEDLVYHYVPERLSFVDNYNSAASYVNGEYCIALGDDDGLLVNIIDCVKWMKANNIDALKPSINAYYFWPDPNSESERGKSGYLNTSTFSGIMKYSDTRKSVIKLLQNGCQEYNSLPMAGTYHRIIRLDCMNEVKSVTGRYYGGLTPDIYSAVSLSLLKDLKFAEIDFPVSLQGICPLSATAANHKGKHCGKLETAPHFAGLKERYVWDERVPKYYSVETIWGETVLKAIHEMKQDELIDMYYNPDILTFFMLKNNPKAREDIIEIVGKEKTNRIEHEYERIKTAHGKSKKIIESTVRRIPGNSIVFSQCHNIEEAVGQMDEFIRTPKMQRKWKCIEVSKS